jgi:hypothetical protein
MKGVQVTAPPSYVTPIVSDVGACGAKKVQPASRNPGAAVNVELYVELSCARS